MKKIGIITYHHLNNYGTMLQALALQQAVAKLNYQAELIDYKLNQELKPSEKLWLRLRRSPVYIIKFRKYFNLYRASQDFKIKYEKFESFYKKNLVVGPVKYESPEALEKNPPVYDGYLVGSDQTWNPYNGTASADVFFLSFAPETALRGSYAPSIAVSSLTPAQMSRMKEQLKRIQYISCREQNSVPLLESLTEKPVTCVLDPTLLLRAEDWDRYASRDTEQEPYILQYFLGDVKSHRKFVEALSQRLGIKVISLPSSYLDVADPKTEKRYVGPDQFLNLIRQAAVICTDSFHGTVFSINYQKPFFSFCKMTENQLNSENSRLFSILDMLNLRSRLITDAGQAKTCTVPLDYTEANRILQEERQKSMDYLETMLSEVE